MLEQQRRRDVDAYGRVNFNVAGLKDLLHCGMAIDDANIFGMDSPLLRQYNDLCKTWDKDSRQVALPPPIAHSPEEEHRIRQDEWLFPGEMASLDVREYVHGLCDRDDEHTRVDMEMDLFEKNGLNPVLHLMVYLIMHFRHNNIIWGVGRGSSVSSYVLFKIGVHKIDSLEYGLDIEEFIKPDRLDDR